MNAVPLRMREPGIKNVAQASSLYLYRQDTCALFSDTKRLVHLLGDGFERF